MLKIFNRFEEATWSSNYYGMDLTTSQSSKVQAIHLKNVWIKELSV